MSQTAKSADLPFERITALGAAVDAIGLLKVS